MLSRLDNASSRFEAWLAVQRPWNSTYGWARTLLAAGTFLTLALNNTDILFRVGAGLPDRVFCGGVSYFSLYCLVPLEYLEVARYISLAGLLVVISGWRPRITGLVHFYLSYSLHASALLVDGGEQVTTVLTLLLLPVTITDPRSSHWHVSRSATSNNFGSQIASLIATSATLAIRIQISIIYLVAAAAKMGVPEWVDGTALYYWLSSPFVGIPQDSILWPLLKPLLATSLVALVTWSALALEFLLAGALFMSQPYRRWLFYPAILFHLAIAFLMGITSFSIAMCGALILYLWPADKPFRRRAILSPEPSVTSGDPTGTGTTGSLPAVELLEAD